MQTKKRNIIAYNGILKIEITDSASGIEKFGYRSFWFRTCQL